jgi:hypothetical protein
MKKNSPKRELTTNKAIAENKRSTIAESIKWISYSIECGFYLEAVVVLESLIADRLESRLCYLKNENVGFQNTGTLIDQICKHEPKSNDDYSQQLVETLKGNNLKLNGWNLQLWMQKRNEVVHQMAKIEQYNFIPFVEKKLSAKSIAENGLKVFREVDRLTNNLRSKNLTNSKTLSH